MFQMFFSKFIKIVLGICLLSLINFSALAEPLTVTTDKKVTLDFLKSEGPTLILHNQYLGTFTLKIDQLEPSSRNASIIGESRVNNESKTLYLGSGTLKLRRGAAGELRASLSAKIDSDTNSYFRIRFTHTRNSGRVYQVSIPLESNTGRLRQVTLRALSEKVCQGEDFSALQNEVKENATVVMARSTSGNQTLKQFTVSTDCDFECYTKLGTSAANDQILEFFNAVSNFYENDLGISLRVTNQVARSTSSVYPSQVTIADDLLNIFHDLAPSLAEADFKHLITGKVMQDNIVGLSSVGVTCSRPVFNQGYSQHLNTLLSPIVIAHELGHNLNAEHDPFSSGIMSARLRTPYPTGFSQFSKTQIDSYVSSLAGLSCYDLIGSGGSSSSSGNSSPGTSLPGIDLTPILKTSFSRSNFSATVSQLNGNACNIELRAAGTEAGLTGPTSVVYSGPVIGQLVLKASKINKVKVKKAGNKALVHLNVTSTCSEGIGTSLTKVMNVAISPAQSKGKTTYRNTKSWISRLKKAISS